jgi:hypothetical protein
MRDLRDIEPAIWRSVQAPGETKLPRLHGILQLLLNREDYNLHDFNVGRRVSAIQTRTTPSTTAR